ncbi:MAG: GrdX protein [Bacteroidetes bacterium 4572_77]|nr:MAG: GrdX protein [Bacteroidetes bacterium 4572_77]
MKRTLITNNPKVYRKNKRKMDMIYSSTYTYLDVLLITRNKIHDGHILLTHPLSGSVKPNETPYKSIIITQDKGKLDMKSLLIIEESIETALKFIEGKKRPLWTEKILQDFQVIDSSIINNAIESIN